MRDQKPSRSWADTLPSQFGPYAPEEVLELHDIPVTEGAGSPAAEPATTGASVALPPRLSLGLWMLEGLRAAVLRLPRTGAAAPTPLQLIVVVLLCSALLVGLERLHVPGPASFQARGWLASWWSLLLLLWCAWWAMGPTPPRDAVQELPQTALSGGAAAWLLLNHLAVLPPVALAYALMAWGAHDPQRWSEGHGPWVFWALYGALLLWMIVADVRLVSRFARSWVRTGVYALVLLASIGFNWVQMPEPSWRPARVASSVDTPEPPSLHLSQPVFEAQQALLQRQTEALLPERPGVTDVYGLVFAPYADENVFRRESTMVSELLQQRFDAQGRVLHLLNHPETAETHVWATPENLQRALAALGARMDREHDLLVIYLTSHGARNHELAASHWPLEVSPITPEMLRTALDEAGIRHRVIAVSACFSGGWIAPLATDDSLIMTAADATHTSYGCGRLSELTFFGRAVFNEQLRQTHSFTEAFAKAVPVIEQREVEAGKTDGFSNPQIQVGTQITPVLQALEQRLDVMDAPKATAVPSAKR